MSPYLTEIYNHAASSSSFPSEIIKVMIVALPKPGKDPNSAQNFHPISLLNNDLKDICQMDRQQTSGSTTIPYPSRSIWIYERLPDS